MRLVPEVGWFEQTLRRAWRTAEMLDQTGWSAPVRCEELEPDYPPHKVLGVLARHEDLDSVAIVGHRPGLHELVSYLLTGDTIREECGARVQIKKGGVAHLSFDGLPEPGVGSLEWVLTPKALRAGSRSASAGGRRGRLAAERDPREGLQLGTGRSQVEQGDLDTLNGDLPRANRGSARQQDGNRRGRALHPPPEVMPGEVERSVVFSSPHRPQTRPAALQHLAVARLDERRSGKR